MKREGFNLDDYKELPYFESLKLAIEEKDLGKIKELITEYDEVLKRNPYGIVAESPGPGYQASPDDVPVTAKREKGIYFKTDNTVVLKHSQFKREMYIYQRMQEAVEEAKSTDVRYDIDDVIAEAYAIIEGGANV